MRNASHRSICRLRRAARRVGGNWEGVAGRDPRPREPLFPALLLGFATRAPPPDCRVSEPRPPLPLPTPPCAPSPPLHVALAGGEGASIASIFPPSLSTSFLSFWAYVPVSASVHVSLSVSVYPLSDFSLAISCSFLLPSLDPSPVFFHPVSAPWLSASRYPYRSCILHPG